MGSGKTQSTITYLNEHSDSHFIYITPYLDEAKRIKDGCPDLHFVEPKQLWKNNYSKLTHTQELILNGANITTTHQAFKNYTPEMLEAIRKYEYTLIIDEAVDVLEECDFHEDDIQLALDAGYIKFENGSYSIVNTSYNGVAFRELFWMLKSRQITRLDIDSDECGGTKRKLYYWVLPPDLVTSFRDVFILTYMFEGQSLHSFLKIHHLPYVNIGIERTETGNGYRFCNGPGYVPDYVSHISEMIEIVDNEKLNEIGNEETALSMRWFEKNQSGAVQKLKNNIYNLYFNIWKGADVSERMWSTYKNSMAALKGRGYTNCFSVLNMRATNRYKTAQYLTYACNLYMNVNEKRFYAQNGVEVDDGRYALSIMLQWIWRSAIREGQKIYIYLPSSRMRWLLRDWMDSLEKGGHDIAGEEVQSVPVLRQVPS